MSIFACCEREDETKYLHTCECPQISPIRRYRERTMQMCGMKDPDVTPADGIYYKIRKNTAEVDRYLDGPFIGLREFSRDDDGICQEVQSSTGSQNCQGYGTHNVGPYYKERIQEFQVNQSSLQGACGGTATSPNYNDTLTKSWDGSNCIDTLSNDAQAVQITIGTDCNQPCVPPDSSGSEQYGTNYSGSGSIPYSSTTGWNGQITGTYVEDSSCLSGGSSTSYPHTFNISLSRTLVGTTFDEELDQSDGGTIVQGISYESPDTDEAAEEATDFGEWNPVGYAFPVSFSQERNKYLYFSQTEAEYAFLATGLISGTSYSGYATTKDCDSIVGEPEDCVEGNRILLSFVASDIFKIIGGTLNSSVDRDDFVANNYSLDPLDYNLAEGEDVIDGLQPFVVSFAEKRKMDSSFIEMA